MERNARHITFSLENLCSRVLKNCSGAHYIKSIKKSEVSYNSVLIFTMDNGEKLVARLPTSVAGPRKLTTSSEVATIMYLQRHTSIRIPKVLDWSDDASNPVECEYIFMEFTKGVELRKIWFDLDIADQLSSIGNLVQQIGEIAGLVFPAYGSLYFRDSAAISEFRQIPIDETFSVGPHCGRVYWDCTVGEKPHYLEVSPDYGPWTDLSEYVDGLIDTGLTRLPPNDNDSQSRRPFQGTMDEHRDLLHTLRKLLYTISKEPCIRDNAAPTLLHPDLHMSNIFVNPNNPTEITATIDWQSASLEPAFATVRPILDFALTLAYLAATEQKERGREMTTPQIWETARDAGFHVIPRLAPLIGVDENLLGPFRYCHRTWRDGIAAMGCDLVDLARKWDSLGLSSPCPYDPPIGGRLEDLEAKFESLTNARKLKQGLDDTLEVEDGWMQAERWEDVQDLNKKLWQGVVESPAEPDADMTLEELKAIWPYEIPL